MLTGSHFNDPSIPPQELWPLKHASQERVTPVISGRDLGWHSRMYVWTEHQLKVHSKGTQQMQRVDTGHAEHTQPVLEEAIYPEIIFQRRQSGVRVSSWDQD